MGKHKPIFDPSTDCGDYVVATGCRDLLVTGKKVQQKKYYRHSTPTRKFKRDQHGRIDAEMGWRRDFEKSRERDVTKE